MKKILYIAVGLFILSTGTVFADDSGFHVTDGMISEYRGDEEKVIIPSKINGCEIVGINSYAFAGNDKLKSVVISDGIEVINMYAFQGCDSLTEITVPESMLLINDYAFSGCYALNRPEICGQYTVVQENAFEDEPGRISLFSEENEEFSFAAGVITAYNGTSDCVRIPAEIDGQTVTAIGQNAFAGNADITEVIIPDTVTVIGDNAFKDCVNLNSVTLPQTLMQCGKYTFSGCISLKRVEIPGSLKKLGNYMFNGCKGLTEVILGEGITDTGEYTFYYCSSLEKVEAPSTLKTVGTWVFGFCKKLKAFEIPNSVNNIGSAAFYYCNTINNIYMPDTVTSFGTHCFRECWALNDIILSKSLRVIPYRAFHNCGFEFINIPHGIENISIEAFWYCQKLKKLEIPSSITTIGNQAFYNCTSLQYVIMYDSVSSIGSNIFALNKIVKLYVPEASYAASYAEQNSIPYELMLKSVSGVADEGTVGLVARVNVPDVNEVSAYGTQYIPLKLYNIPEIHSVSVGYTADEQPIKSGQTYMTVMDGIPNSAADWYFVCTPYLQFKNGTILNAVPKVISVNDTVLHNVDDVNEN